MCKLTNKISCSKCEEILCEEYPNPDCPYTKQLPQCDLFIEYQVLQIAHSELQQQYFSLIEKLHDQN